MKKLLVSLLLVALFPALLPAQEKYLEVTAPGNSLLQLAIAPPVPLAGKENAETAREVSDVLNFDLGMSGLFRIQPTASTGGTGGVKPGEFSFDPWKAIGTDILVKCGYIADAGRLTLECRLFDVVRGSELTVKRYSGPMSERRHMAHLFDDEALRAITGTAGAFSGKIAFVATTT